MSLCPPPDSNPATMERVLDAVHAVQTGIAAIRSEIAKSVMGQTAVVDQV
ncbi:MAG: hypothetical protein HOL13_08315, partial [Phycisphaerae bacterium]|nr:hypothetical protein [Phycisphaerae bacterium]